MEITFSWVINILITVFLVIDSKKHGKSPVLWGILGFLFGLIALAIYLIRTDRKVLGWIILVVSILFYLFIILFFLAVIFLAFS